MSEENNKPVMITPPMPLQPPSPSKPYLPPLSVKLSEGGGAAKMEELDTEWRQADGDVVQSLDGKLEMAKQGDIVITEGSVGYTIERGNERFSAVSPSVGECWDASGNRNYIENKELIEKVGQEVRDALKGRFWGLSQGNLSEEEAAKIVGATLDSPQVCAAKPPEDKPRGRE